VVPEKVDHDTVCRCGHLVDPHLMIATGHPLDGGYMLCPEKDCDCIGTWSVQNGPRPDPLEEWEKPLMREYLLQNLDDQEYWQESSAGRSEDKP
jgi:hypothetical protein